MIELIIENISFRKEITNGLTSIAIDLQSIFRKFYLDPEFYLSFIEYGEELKFEVIKNPFDIDLNEKKATQLLYKEISGSVNRNYLNEYERVVDNLISLIKNTFPDLINSNVEISANLDKDKLFQALNIKYSVDESFLSNFLNYIKYKAYITRHNIFITFNLRSFLTASEYNTLNIELEKEQVVLIDFYCLIKDSVNEKKFLIDENLCII